MRRHVAILFIALMWLSAPLLSSAQRRAGKRATAPRTAPVSVTPATTADERKRLQAETDKSRDELVKATKFYKERLQESLVLLAHAVAQATEERDKIKSLYVQGYISKRKLEESESKLIKKQAESAEIRRQIAGADALVAQTLEEAKLEEQIAKAPPLRAGSLVRTTAYIRYQGTASWSLFNDANKVQSFFATRFKRALPVSAFGQTAVHDRLGFDHRNSMDVAVQPDSVEGQALINYLRGAGIPFLAFRVAIPGTATGPHVHVGRPSHRLYAR